jgi:hypothetical protein
VQNERIREDKFYSNRCLSPARPSVAQLRLNFAAFGAAGLGVGGASPVIGFLDQTMRLGHVLKLPFDSLRDDVRDELCSNSGRNCIVRPTKTEGRGS